MENTAKNFVAYYRVSTQRQGKSGLGLEAQRKMVADYVASVGGALVGEFTEIESGKNHTNRPKLKNALALARKSKAVLIVAKLDRLARNVAFVSALLETPGVEFRAADFPSANRMMIQLLAVFAEYEREQIKIRTKAALAAAKARGVKLGTVENLLQGNSPAPEMNRAKAKAEAERLRPIINTLKAESVNTVRGIAAELNRRGYTTERGGEWHPTQVARLLSRLAA
jgi:DNA invertase Pin-like site-specific DNA recombinase